MVDVAADALGFERFLGAVAVDRAPWPDFEALCDFGGRLTGSPGEAAARDWAAGRLAAIPGGTLRRDPVRYAGWTCDAVRLTELSTGRDLDVVPLLAAAATPADGLTLKVVDCGRGSPELIRLAGDAVKGRAVLVRHEYPFASWTIHRRVVLEATHQPDALTETLVLDLPGRGPERVVLSAHIDGHSLSESALDNATGVVAVLALARAIAPFVAGMARGLTVCLFSAEEWALTGSRAWLEAMAPEDRARIVFNLNLDSIAGAASLTALTSDFPALGGFVQGAADATGLALAVHQPLMSNSDHANFAAHGIPALRLLAGFDEPNSNLRHLLTRADTRLLTNVRELKASALAAGSVLWHALQADSETLAVLRCTRPG